ncbi:hypothetical protein GOBAR_AA34792 [Gossypium barbadense]|uniref:Uncharacterized protein n=1 Tax=Gossypium barbadense TaxID=3634 RepID=A0A2P5W469_GOSBA|nr:hypothetical protein GOBAR_AA34792 [Gossypium barbadense]
MAVNSTLKQRGRIGWLRKKWFGTNNDATKFSHLTRLPPASSLMALEKEAVLAAAPSDSPTMSATWNLVSPPPNLQSQPSKLPSCSPLPADLSLVNAPIDSPVVPMTNSPTPTLNTLPENTPIPIDSLQKTPPPKQLRVYTRKRRHIPETVLQSDSCRELDLGPAAEIEEEINCKEEYIVAKSAEEALMKARDKYGKLFFT